MFLLFDYIACNQTGMRKFYWLIIISITGCTQGSLKKEQQLQSLLDKKEYFKLREKFQSDQGDISDQKKIYFQAYLENVFNQNDKSIEDIESLRKQYDSSIPDSIRADLLRLESDNYFKTFQYAKSAHADSDLLNHYKMAMDSEGVDNLKNDLLIRNALYYIPPQQVSITENTTIPWARDKVGLVEIPLKHNDSSYSSIFDTRANISSISKSYAQKLGLKILDVSYEEGSGITGITFKTGMGIADSLYIGNILLRNVVFQVMPDEVLYIAPIQFSLNIIIGYPVIAQLKEVHIYQDGKMMIPYRQTKTGLHNLAMDKLNPVLSVKINNDDLCFYFDSGAGSSDFFNTYFERYKDKIIKKGKLQTIQNGGAGGIVNAKVYVTDSIDVFVANQKATLNNVSIHVDAIKTHNNETFYGNLGQDLINQFKEMILNFDDMYIDFRK